MKKLILIFLFCIKSGCLSACDVDSFPQDVISLYDLKAIHFLQEKGFFENSYGANGRYTSVTVRSEKELALLNFRKQRTKELQIMREELNNLKIMLYSSGIIRTKDHKLNIASAINIYSQELIPQRELEEQLSSLVFFQQYNDRWQDLAKDIQATRNRVDQMNW
jgi:hypothetical protein